MRQVLLFWRRKRKSLSSLTYDNMSSKLINRASMLCGILIIHSIIIQYVESISFFDSLWLSLTSITTVGYGDYSATTWVGRVATIVLIYIYGIWLLAQFVGDFIDYRVDRREKMIRGLWRWENMSDNILIINTPSVGGERYLIRLVAQIKQTPDIDTLPIQIATAAYPKGLPNILRRMNVVHYHVDTSSTVYINDINIDTAKYIIILCEDEHDMRSDSLTLDLLDRISQKKNPTFIITECIADENRARFKRLQANVVIRPIRSYPELIVRALSAPGTECVLENLFTHSGSSTQRFDLSLRHVKWRNIVCQLISAGVGTPLGFIGEDGQVITNPDGNILVTACALLIMVNEKNQPSISTITAALQ